MKKLSSVVTAFIVLAVASVSFAGSIKGPIQKITANPDGSYTTVIKDEASSKEYTIEVTDDLTKDKISSKKIMTGDDVKVKFDENNGKNVSNKFLKTAGC